MRAALLVSVLLLAAGTGWAFDTGNEFLKECEPGAKTAFTQLTNEEQLFGMACGGYIRGFVGAIRVAEAGTSSKMICSPSGIETLQAMRISIQWMKDHTGELQKPAVELIFQSLADAFPCSKPGSPPKKSEGKDRLTL